MKLGWRDTIIQLMKDVKALLALSRFQECYFCVILLI